MAKLRALLRTIQAMWRILAGQNRRGRIVNHWARLVILGVVFGVVVPLVVWPFVLLGVSLTGSAGLIATVAFLPLVAFPVFVIVLAVAYPLLSGILVAIPGIRVFLGWLLAAVFAELVIGLYLVVIPVWNNPRLIPVLILFSVVLGMWLSLKQQMGWRWGSKFTKALALAIAGVTIAFFFSGKAEKREVGAGGETATEVAETPLVEEFVLDKGQEFLTVVVGPDTMHVIQANKPWVAVVRATGKEYQMSAGKSCWKGGGSQGLLRVKGLEDGTTLHFQRQKT